MVPRVDVIGKIQQLYMQARPVPYLTFVHVLNDLLADSAQAVPGEPSGELREKFRAACMCVNVGIIDAEGREELRVREFREKLYPLWKSKLPAEEFSKYEEILQGSLREKRRLHADERGLAAQQEADRSRELLAKLGLVELEVEPPAAVPAPVELPTREAAPALLEGVDELCAAIRAGQVNVEYLEPSPEGELARYRLDDLEVVVKLAQTEEHTYTVLRAEIGRSGLPDAEERIDGFAAEMRYLRMADYAYMRRDEEFVFTLNVGPNATNLACASVQEGTEEDIVRRIQKLHQDLGELVERMRQ